MKIIRALAFAAATTCATSGLAQDAAPQLSIEINTADMVGEACRLTFLLSNGMKQDIDKLVAETVLFSADGQVVLLTLFDFGKIPAGRPRVRQFQVPDTSCAALGQVLVNGLQTCEIGGAASEACDDGLSLSSRTDVALEG